MLFLQIECAFWRIFCIDLVCPWSWCLFCIQLIKSDLWNSSNLASDCNVFDLLRTDVRGHFQFFQHLDAWFLIKYITFVLFECAYHKYLECVHRHEYYIQIEHMSISCSIQNEKLSEVEKYSSFEVPWFLKSWGFGNAIGCAFNYDVCSLLFSFEVLCI